MQDMTRHPEKYVPKTAWDTHVPLAMDALVAMRSRDAKRAKAKHFLGPYAHQYNSKSL